MAAGKVAPRQQLNEESTQTMSSALYQSIELLSREKGIEPQIVVGAVEEAIALATRKYYKTQENMRGELNKRRPARYGVRFKTVVGEPDEIRGSGQRDYARGSQRIGAGR